MSIFHNFSPPLCLSFFSFHFFFWQSRFIVHVLVSTNVRWNCLTIKHPLLLSGPLRPLAFAHCFGDVVGLWNVLYTPLSLSRPSFITVIIEVIRRLERSRQTGREKGLCRWLSSLNLYRRRFPPASRSIFSRKPASRSSLLVAGRFSIVTLLECSYISCLFDHCKLGTV